MLNNGLKEIRFRYVLFDLGGVLLNIDYNRTIRAFRDLGFENFNVAYSQSRQDGVFDDFETGRIGREGFIGKIKDMANAELSEDQIVSAWNAMLLDFPQHRLVMLQELNAKYPLFLLSNTNEIHFRAFNENFRSTYKMEFDSLFNKAYYSHRIGMRKPNREIFELVCDEQAIEPDNLLFIDDSIQHVEGARKMGIQGLLLTEEKDIKDLLIESGVLT